MRGHFLVERCCHGDNGSGTTSLSHARKASSASCSCRLVRKSAGGASGRWSVPYLAINPACRGPGRLTARQNTHGNRAVAPAWTTKADKNARSPVQMSRTARRVPPTATPRVSARWSSKTDGPIISWSLALSSRMQGIVDISMLLERLWGRAWLATVTTSLAMGVPRPPLSNPTHRSKSAVESECRV